MTPDADARPVLVIGESMGLVRQEQPGQLYSQRTLGFGFGGAESNVAIALARLGTPVSWLGRLGQDSLGDMIVRELRAEGVLVHGVRDTHASTGMMLKERPTPRATRVVYYRRGSAGSRLSPEDLPPRTVEEAALLHLTGITPALSESASAAVDAAMARARRAGVLISFDLNYRAALWAPEVAAPRMRELVEQADIVFAGDDEAALLFGRSGAEQLAAQLRALGPMEAVIKLGERGCFAIDGEERLSMAAVPVDAVDTVGAGDAFVAGYLAERLSGASLTDRLRLAVRTGAFACLSAGDWEGLPHRRDLDLLDAEEPVQR